MKLLFILLFVCCTGSIAYIPEPSLDQELETLGAQRCAIVQNVVGGLLDDELKVGKCRRGCSPRVVSTIMKGIENLIKEIKQGKISIGNHGDYGECICDCKPPPPPPQGQCNPGCVKESKYQKGCGRGCVRMDLCCSCD